MIADAIYNDDEPPTIYTRYREQGALFEKTIHGFKPYMYIPVATPEFRLKQLARSYPNATILTDVMYDGLDGQKLYKVETDSPYEISQMRNMFSKTYESDVRYIDQYLIDSVPEMPKWKPRKWWYDIECNTGDDNYTTIISVIDSDIDMPIVFAWTDETTNCPYDIPQWFGPDSHPHGTTYRREVRDIEYDLRLYRSEKALYNGLLK